MITYKVFHVPREPEKVEKHWSINFFSDPMKKCDLLMAGQQKFRINYSHGNDMVKTSRENKLILCLRLIFATTAKLGCS